MKKERVVLLFQCADSPTLPAHPRCGASWEGFALEQLLRLVEPDEAYFRATHAGAELDLLMIRSGQRVGIEFKRADAPTRTRSMMIAMSDLRLDALCVICPGPHHYALAPGHRGCSACNDQRGCCGSMTHMG